MKEYTKNRKENNRIETIHFDWITLIAYYAYKKLDSNSNHRHFVFSEIDDFLEVIADTAKHNGIIIRIDEYQMPQAAIRENSNFFVPYITNTGQKGFSINYDISPNQIFTRFIACLFLNNLELLDESYKNFDKFFLV